jgi:hypothetical protein
MHARPVAIAAMLTAHFTRVQRGEKADMAGWTSFMALRHSIG